MVFSVYCVLSTADTGCFIQMNEHAAAVVEEEGIEAEAWHLEGSEQEKITIRSLSGHPRLWLAACC